MPEELAGKRALVTGGGAGIGSAICRLFAARGAGVMVCDADSDAAERVAAELPDAGHAVACDVTSSDDVRAAVEAAVARLGGLDILVNSAGLEVARPLADHTEEDFARLLDLNVTGIFRTTRHAREALTDGGGSIVNIASVAGLGAAPLFGAAATTKGAVIRFTEVCAAELRDAGVRVNAICPGFVDTAMLEQVTSAVEAATGTPFADIVAHRQGRLARPEEVAELAAFLASDDASFVSGTHLVLDGGVSASFL